MICWCIGAAYFLATRAGLEDDPSVLSGSKAVALSDDGPIWKITPKDFLDQCQSGIASVWIWSSWPWWDSDVSCAEGINKSLNDLMLFLLCEPMENDPRRRATIPAYSGQRKPLSLILIDKWMDVTHCSPWAFWFAWHCIGRFWYGSHHIQLFAGFLMKNEGCISSASRIKDARQIRDFLATVR